MNEFKKIIGTFGKRLNAKGIQPIIVGGWAINLLGFVRQTVDFDINVESNDFEKLCLKYSTVKIYERIKICLKN